MQGIDIRFGERATFAIDYNLPTGAAFDFGGGFMITPMIGVGVSFSGTRTRMKRSSAPAFRIHSSPMLMRPASRRRMRS